MVKSNDINTTFLVDVVFGGDLNRAIEVTREYKGVKVQLLHKSVERYAIRESIEAGATNDEIIREFEAKGITVSRARIERLRKNIKRLYGEKDS